MMRLNILLLFASTAIAQTDSPPMAQPAPSMKFDVASVRPVKIEPGVSWGGVFFRPFDSSHLTGTGDIRSILQAAFSVEYYQIVGYDQLSPDLRQAFYTIEAHGDENTDKLLSKLPKAQRHAEQQHMYQALLVDRLQLKVHWEDRLMPGYRLVIPKRGSKLLPAGSLPRDPNLAKMRVGPDMVPAVIYPHHDDLVGIVYAGRGATLADIAGIVAFRMGEPIQAATEPDGSYDFDLRLPDRTAGDTAQDDQASVIDAIQGQLGLRLETARVVQRVLFIDHLEPPSPN